jgi:hypothetical protein
MPGTQGIHHPDSRKVAIPEGFPSRKQLGQMGEVEGTVAVFVLRAHKPGAVGLEIAVREIEHAFRKLIDIPIEIQGADRIKREKACRVPGFGGIGLWIVMDIEPSEIKRTQPGMSGELKEGGGVIKAIHIELGSRKKFGGTLEFVKHFSESHPASIEHEELDRDPPTVGEAGKHRAQGRETHHFFTAPIFDDPTPVHAMAPDHEDVMIGREMFPSPVHEAEEVARPGGAGLKREGLQDHRMGKVQIRAARSSIIAEDQAAFGFPGNPRIVRLDHEVQVGVRAHALELP